MVPRCRLGLKPAEQDGIAYQSSLSSLRNICGPLRASSACLLQEGDSKPAIGAALSARVPKISKANGAVDLSAALALLY